MGGLVGRRVKRVEDRRFLTGRGHYVDDFHPMNMLYAAFLRSPYPHARIVRIDSEEARRMPGILAVVTGETMVRWARPLRTPSTMASYRETSMPILATGKVRYVGEAIAMVIASSRYAAEDALDHITVEYEPLDPVVELKIAVRDEAPLVHEEAGSNILVTREFARGEVKPGIGTEITDDAAVIVREQFRFRRHAALCIEPRGCLAEYNSGSATLRLRSATQCPGVVRTAIAHCLDMHEHQVHVVASDVGGGFGAKSSAYPEEIAVCAAARSLDRPIKWISDRREDLLTTSQGWDELIDAELAVSAEGRIISLKAEVLADVGAYSVYPWALVIEPVQTASFLPGPYRIQNYWAKASAVATCKAPTGPYRGVGRPISAFVMEGLMDRAARRLGIDPTELRLRNYIRPDEFPYKTATGIVWDQAEFIGCMTKARELVQYEAVRAEQKRGRESGRLLGVGFASYAELTGIGSATPASPGMPTPAGTEAATVRVDPSGSVTAIFGIASHGQGLETTLAQIVADELGIALDKVRIVCGDTSFCPYGTGSYASRGAVLGGGAAILASRAVREKADEIARHILETRPAVALRGEDATAHNIRQIPLREIAQAAYAGSKRLPKGMEPGLEATRFYDPYYGTTTAATHAAVVEVDPETFAIKVLRYVVVEDCGRTINPSIVDGQVIGGVVQGLGGALLEEVVYDSSGQLVTGSLMDYLVPSACEAPAIVVKHLEVVSPTSLGGMRGVGESGTIGAPAAIANAVADALVPLGLVPNELPITPARLFQTWFDAGASAAS
jgi:carbon-monoxide dehydrogenase large subunit